MAQGNRVLCEGNFGLVVLSLLFTLVFTGAAAAQKAVPQINEPLVPDTVAPGGAGSTSASGALTQNKSMHSTRFLPYSSDFSLFMSAFWRKRRVNEVAAEDGFGVRENRLSL